MASAVISWYGTPLPMESRHDTYDLETYEYLDCDLACFGKAMCVFSWLQLEGFGHTLDPSPNPPQRGAKS